MSSRVWSTQIVSGIFLSDADQLLELETDELQVGKNIIRIFIFAINSIVVFIYMYSIMLQFHHVINAVVTDQLLSLQLVKPFYSGGIFPKLSIKFLDQQWAPTD